MQYIFQNPYGSLNPTMTVVENVEEPLRHFERLSRRNRRRLALEVLPTVALNEDFADRLPAELSGGERQRVAVARALVVNPEILICDEITSALDVSVQALLIEQLRSLQLDHGLGIMFITHNLAVVRSLAQRVIVLQEGVVVERGLVEDVLDNPQHAYTRQLLSDLPHILEPAELAIAR
jgi:peptide/nickel transport system ATP-binding protein